MKDNLIIPEQKKTKSCKEFGDLVIPLGFERQRPTVQDPYIKSISL